MNGRIHSFQSLGTVDGPGVRCVVFVQGCPLRCICCHNPDTWDFSGGNEVDTDSLVKKILRYRSYFGENGGVTVSGGEPLCQADFVAELFSKLKTAGVHTALDTSGCVLNSDVLNLLQYTDLVLLDHKYPTDEEYRKYTGGSLESIEKFMLELEKRQIKTWLRRVIIPQKSDSIKSVQELNAFANRFSCVERIELLPFRNLCNEKYEKLGIEFSLKYAETPSNDLINELYANIDKKYKLN